MASTVSLLEFFEVYTLVALDGDKIIVLFLVVTDEEILGITTWIWNIYSAKFFHVKNCLMFSDFKINVVGFEIIVGLLLVHKTPFISGYIIS